MKLYLVMVRRPWTAGRLGGTGSRWVPVMRYRYEAHATARAAELRTQGLDAKAHIVDLDSLAAPPELRALSVPEVARALQVSEDNIYYLIRKRHLRFRRLGKAYWIDQASVIERIDAVIGAKWNRWRR